MPISASSLPWWGWLLVSLGAFVVGGIAHVFADDKKTGCVNIAVATLAGLTGVVTGITGLIVLVRSVWKR
jgi:hypothetical protein